MLPEQTFTHQSLSPTQDSKGVFPFSLADFIPNLIDQKAAPREETTHQPDHHPLKEIPNPEKDKLIVILNFILKEVLPIQDPEKQKALLVYFFRSILTETQKLPVTHLAYEITSKDNGLALHDDIYLLRPDLLQICQDAVESLAINQAEKNRYQLEKSQVENLLTSLNQLFALSPHAMLSLLAKQTYETEDKVIQPDANITREKLENTGWVTLSPQQAFTFIQPEVKEKMKLEKLAGEITLGPKYLYVMPQSEVHEGNLSVIVIAQPVFIPTLNRFILLHDQHLAPKNWEDHQKLFNIIGAHLPQNFTELPFAEKEQLVMEKLISLPTKFQVTPADETFLELFPKQKFFQRLRQKITRMKIKQMEPALEQYSQLLIDVVTTEVKRDPSLSPNTVTKLSNFMKRVVFAGILDTKKISAQKRTALFDHFKKFGNLTENDFALSLKGIGFSSAVKAFDTSLLECVALSPISSVQQLANLQLQGLTPASLSRVDLAKFVGNQRAKEWKIGSCLKCGANNTWVGECDWCLNCEMNYNLPKVTSLDSSPIFKSAINKNKTHKPIIDSESLGSFVANLI
ncbi:MAG: hypothetical protein ACOZAK_04680 [Patescibacteria group bacterium]